MDPPIVLVEPPVLIAAHGKAKTRGKAEQIRQALENIDQEYDRLQGLPQATLHQQYVALTSKFRNSKDLIQGIIDDRKNLVTGINTAAEILNAVGPLIALI